MMAGLFGLPQTLTKYEIPKNECHNEYQTIGYRPSHQPWTNYLLSVFQPNNQCMNVWTHFIPFLVIVQQTISLATTYDLISDPYMRPLGAAMISFAILFLVSSIAHCFCDHSELTNFLCFFIDYCAIGLFGMGTSLLSHNYFVKDENLAYFFEKFSVPVGVIVNIMGGFLSCFAKVLYGQKKRGDVIKGIAVGLSYLWFQVPIIHQALIGHNDATIHIAHTFWFLVCAFFFITHIPERWFPGTFDIFGHSHHYFHLSLFISCELLIKTTLGEMQKGIWQRTFDSPITRPVPSLLRTYGSLLDIGLVDALFVMSFYQWIQLKISDNTKHKSNVIVNNNSKDY